MPGQTYVIFTLDEEIFAMDASSITYVIRAVQPKLPLKVPELLLGLINMGGKIIPLVDIRKQFGLSKREIYTSDRIIITESSGYPAAFVVDTILGVEEIQVRRACILYPQMQEYMAGIATLNNQTVLIYNIDTLIPPETIKQVNQSIEAAS